jgi:hypothetical protein
VGYKFWISCGTGNRFGPLLQGGRLGSSRLHSRSTLTLCSIEIQTFQIQEGSHLCTLLDALLNGLVVAVLFSKVGSCTDTSSSLVLITHVLVSKRTASPSGHLLGRLEKCPLNGVVVYIIRAAFRNAHLPFPPHLLHPPPRPQRQASREGIHLTSFLTVFK